MGIRSVKRRQFLALFRDSCFDQCFVTESLVADSLCEKFVEIELILHEEVDAAGIELHNSLVHNLRIWKDIKIEWSHDILVLF